MATPTIAAEELSSIARGGRLYDKWFVENKAAKPTADHSAYPKKGGEYGKDTSWRCKECHGWDGMGKDGAYSKGSHATGIKGVNAYWGKDAKAVAAIIRNPLHAYTDTQLSAKDVDDIALFVTKGMIDMTKYVDAANNKSKGDPARGEGYFNTLCAGCHGLDGKKVTTGPSLGSVASNGWEMMHKVMNGQPSEPMPSLRALEPQISADIVAHLQTLSK
jgi:mono/diheme cytochrome c family protein